MSIPVVPPPAIFEPEDCDRIQTAFLRDGFVVIRALDQAACDAAIKEQVKEILLQQPWERQLEVRDPRSGALLDIDRDTPAYLASLTAPRQPRAVLAQWEEAWPFHAGFGAACDPAAFHLRKVWKLRQDPRLYNVARRLTGRKRLWVDVNRAIQKKPGKGEDEFVHWDTSPWGATWGDALIEALHGKACFTRSSLVCVPGTASEAFRARFVAAYAAHYPNARPGAAKFGLDPSKPDPLGLLAQRVAIDIPAGCVVFWNRNLLHGVRRKGLDEAIEFGAYLGFMPAVDRPEYRRLAGVSELEDRVASYREGRAPLLWPSLDRIYYFPKRYLNFPKMLAPYYAKTRADWPGRTTRLIQSGPRKGETVPHMVPVRTTRYKRPHLTRLGKRLLGLRPWPERRR